MSNHYVCKNINFAQNCHFLSIILLQEHIKLTQLAKGTQIKIFNKMQLEKSMKFIFVV